jgi:hypothetical protein
MPWTPTPALAISGGSVILIGFLVSVRGFVLDPFSFPFLEAW